MFETRQILGPSGPAALGHMARMALAGVVRSTVTSLCAAALLLLAGCGQKGPLYLPDGQTSTAPPPATSPHKTQR
jgi:predicted small lipoprotein YifL